MVSVTTPTLQVREQRPASPQAQPSRQASRLFIRQAGDQWPLSFLALGPNCNLKDAQGFYQGLTAFRAVGSFVYCKSLNQPEQGYGHDPLDTDKTRVPDRSSLSFPAPALSPQLAPDLSCWSVVFIGSTKACGRGSRPEGQASTLRLVNDGPGAHDFRPPCLSPLASGPQRVIGSISAK